MNKNNNSPNPTILGDAWASNDTSTEALARYMAGTGLFVKVRVQRDRGRIPLSTKMLGFEKAQLSEEGNKFFSERVTSGFISFIPPGDEKDLMALEQRARRALKEKILAGDFVPYAGYKALEEEIAAIAEEYMAKRDEILLKWDLLQSSFKEGLEQILRGSRLSISERSALFAVLLAEQPQKEAYAASFGMSLVPAAMPRGSGVTPEMGPELSAEVEAAWRESVVNTALQSVALAVGACWEKAIGAISQYMKRGKIFSLSVTNLAETGRDLEWKNVFGNSLLQELSEILKEAETLSVEELVETLEYVVGIIWHYSRDNNLSLSREGCPYATDQLDELARIATMAV